MEILRKNLILFVFAAFTIGLLPYGDSHLMGKLRWVAGGGAFSGEQPMKLIDWIDLLMHGIPWILLVLSLIAIGVHQIKKGKSN